MVLCLAPSAGQAQSSARPRIGYDKSWYISEFWSGEYPKGFSVTERNITVMARSAMNRELPRTVGCRLPYRAVIHPWNKERIRKHHVRFFSAGKIVDLIAKENFEFEFSSKRAPHKARLAIEKDDVIQYLHYLAEGLFIVQIKGRKYEAGQNLFDHVQDVPDDKLLDDEWVSLTCLNGARAYIYFRDLRAAEKAAPAFIEVGDRQGTNNWVPGVNTSAPGVIGYGRARDLTVGEAEDLEKARGTGKREKRVLPPT